MKIILLAPAMMLAGCITPPTYYHPTKSQSDFERDSYDCEMDARQRATYAGSPGNPILIPDYYRDCMTRKHGYTEGKPAETT